MQFIRNIVFWCGGFLFGMKRVKPYQSEWLSDEYMIYRPHFVMGYKLKDYMRVLKKLDRYLVKELPTNVIGGFQKNRETGMYEFNYDAATVVEANAGQSWGGWNFLCLKKDWKKVNAILEKEKCVVLSSYDDFTVNVREAVKDAAFEVFKNGVWYNHGEDAGNCGSCGEHNSMDKYGECWNCGYQLAEMPTDDVLIDIFSGANHRNLDFVQKQIVKDAVAFRIAS